MPIKLPKYDLPTLPTPAKLMEILGRYGSPDIEWTWRRTVHNPMPQSADARVELTLHREKNYPEVGGWAEGPWEFWDRAMSEFGECCRELGDAGWVPDGLRFVASESRFAVEFDVALEGA